MKTRKTPLKLPTFYSEQSRKFVLALNQHKLDETFLKQCQESASHFKMAFTHSTQTP